MREAAAALPDAVLGYRELGVSTSSGDAAFLQDGQGRINRRRLFWPSQAYTVEVKGEKQIKLLLETASCWSADVSAQQTSYWLKLVLFVCKYTLLEEARTACRLQHDFVVVVSQSELAWIWFQKAPGPCQMLCFKDAFHAHKKGCSLRPQDLATRP